jgi:Flp pilus assembly protein TadG
MRLSRSTATRSGAAAVELALLMPLVAFLLLGVWEVGRMLNISQILSNAAREGARQASTGQNTASQVQTAVLNYLQDAGIPTANVNVTVSDLTSAGTDPANAGQLDQLQVTVTIPFADVRWIALNFIAGSGSQISGSAIWLSLKDQTYPSTVTPPLGF